MMSPHLLALGCAAAALAVAAPMARAADLVVAAPAPLERLADTAFAAPFAAATHRATSVVPLTPPPAPARSPPRPRRNPRPQRPLRTRRRRPRLGRARTSC